MMSLSDEDATCTGLLLWVEISSNLVSWEEERKGLEGEWGNNDPVDG